MLNNYKNTLREDDPEQTYITFINPDHEDSSDEKWGGYVDEQEAREAFDSAMYSGKYMDRNRLVGDFLTAVVKSDRTGHTKHIERFLNELKGEGPVNAEELTCGECGREFPISDYTSESSAKTALGVHQSRSH